jgi:hypothetical protein
MVNGRKAETASMKFLPIYQKGLAHSLKLHHLIDYDNEYQSRI